MVGHPVSYEKLLMVSKGLSWMPVYAIHSPVWNACLLLAWFVSLKPHFRGSMKEIRVKA
jgi:hypothetical protein